MATYNGLVANLKSKKDFPETFKRTHFFEAGGGEGYTENGKHHDLTHFKGVAWADDDYIIEAHINVDADNRDDVLDIHKVMPRPRNKFMVLFQKNGNLSYTHWLVRGGQDKNKSSMVSI